MHGTAARFDVRAGTRTARHRRNDIDSRPFIDRKDSAERRLLNQKSLGRDPARLNGFDFTLARTLLEFCALPDRWSQ